MENKEMKTLKLSVTYGVMMKVLGDFPELLGGEGGCEEEEMVRVREVVEWVGRGFDDATEEGIIHGDFWTGK
jgi:hypothetical protein